MSQTYINTDECWLYAGWQNGRGYGMFQKHGKKYIAHRVMYEAFKGEIPKGLVIDHLCRVPTCINPEHLEAVTNAENIRRGAAGVLTPLYVTHCAKGHEYTEENTYHYFYKSRKVNARICKTCRRNSTRYYKYKYYWEKKAKMSM